LLCSDLSFSELAALKRMFTIGARARKVYSMPSFPHLEERNVRKGFIEDGQYQTLAKACSAEGLWLRAMFEVGYNFGWRVSELLTMRVRQIDLASRAIRLEVGETKNDEGREVEMTPLVYALVQQCVTGKQGEDFVFTRESGKPVRDFRGSWEKVCKGAGVPELLFHDLRRTAVRNMVRRGIPERVAMTISGHKTRSIFDRYNIVSKSDLHEAAKKLALRDQERDVAQANQNDYGYSSDIVEPARGSVAPAGKLNEPNHSNRLASLPGWRNWQTQRTQKRMLLMF
jgi:integrase